MTKILVIRFSSIGDIVLTSPVVRCLKEQIPDCELHFLTKANYASVVENNPHIDKLHLLKDSLRSLHKPLAKEKFDFIIDLHNNLRSLVVKKSLSAKSMTVDKINLQKWLAVNFKKDYLPDEHVVERYMATTKELGIEYDGKGLDHYIADEDNVSISDLPMIMHGGYTALSIGGAHATKRMPESQLIKLGKMVEGPILILGGPEDEAIGDVVMSTDENRIWNACGKYNINQSASLIMQSKVVLTHDTGLMHIAAAYNKKIISVWGNTIPEFGMTPFFKSGDENNSARFEVDGLSCRPCSKIGYESCPKEHFDCMNKLDLEAIANAVNY